MVVPPAASNAARLVRAHPGSPVIYLSTAGIIIIILLLIILL